MSTVFSAHAVSVDGYISGRTLDGDQEFAIAARVGAAVARLKAGLVDELILHQVPVLLGGGRSFFHELPEHVHLHLVEAVPAPGVTHLHYEVVR